MTVREDGSLVVTWQDAATGEVLQRISAPSQSVLSDLASNQRNGLNVAAGAILLDDPDGQVTPSVQSAQVMGDTGGLNLPVDLTTLITVANQGTEIGWTFQIDDAAIGGLVLGEELVFTFDILLTDPFGGASVVQVSSTVAGTLQSLFPANDDTVDFNSVIAGTYADSTQYDALAGNDVVTLAEDPAAAGFDPAQAIDGGLGDDTIMDSSGVDSILGGAGNDVIEGGAGNDMLAGGAGNDTYVWSVGDGFDTVLADGDDNGGDVIIVDGVFENANWGFDDNDLRLAPAIDFNYDFNDTGAVVIKVFRNGDDPLAYIQFEVGPNTTGFYSPGSLVRLYATPGDTGEDQGDFTELVIGTDAAETMTGGGGYRDYLYGQGGNDVFLADDATRTEMRGGSGNDSLIGGANDDRLAGQEGVDYHDGGDGRDLLRYDRDGGPSGVTVDLGVGTAIDSYGNAEVVPNIEDVRGTNFNDVLTGSNENNQIRGRSSDDLIEGLGGNDDLRGEGGTDTFVFAPGSGFDSIRDFNPGALEKIDVFDYGIGEISEMDPFFTGSGTVLFFDDNNNVFLRNVTPDQLTDLNFIFAPDTRASKPSIEGTTQIFIDEDGSGLLELDIQLTDTDGSEILSVEINGVPFGSTFSSGVDLGGGVWQIDVVDLPFVTYLPAPDLDQSHGLGIRAIATETSTSAMAEEFGFIDVVINAMPDAPFVDGDFSVNALEDGGASFGVLNVNDPDSGESGFFAQTVNGAWGTVVIDQSGNWSYAANSADPTVQALAEFEFLPDYVEVQTLDLTTVALTPNVVGTNDDPFLISPIGNQSFAANNGFSFDISGNFGDADTNDSFTYTTSPLPSGVSISSEGLIAGTIAPVGSTLVTVTATDNAGASVSDTFLLDLFFI